MSPDAIREARLKLLDFATDDQLRAECERRATKPLNDGRGRLVRSATAAHCVHGMKLDSSCLMCGFAFDFISERDQLKTASLELARLKREIDQTHMSLAADRDEWKRRANLFEQKYAEELARNAVGSIVREPERPHAATKPSDEHWTDPWDFLEDA